MLCDIFGANCVIVSEEYSREIGLAIVIGIIAGWAMVLWVFLLAGLQYVLQKIPRWKHLDTDVFFGYGLAFFFTVACVGCVVATTTVNVGSNSWQLAILGAFSTGLTALVSVMTALYLKNNSNRTQLPSGP